MSKAPNKPRETASFASRDINRKLAWLLYFFAYQVDCLASLKNFIKNTILEKKDLPISLRNSWMLKIGRITEVREIYRRVLTNLNRSGKPQFWVKGDGDVLHPFDPLKHQWNQIIITDPSSLSIVANVQGIRELEALCLFLYQLMKKEDPNSRFMEELDGRQFLCSYTNQEGTPFQQDMIHSLGDHIEQYDELLNHESVHLDRLSLLETCFQK